MDKRIEKRSFTWEVFIAEITAYYNRNGCDFVLEIGADGSCIFRYDVVPHGRKYFYKRIPDETDENWQDEALAELKSIFFEEEDVVIRGIYQWPEISEADVTLFVKLNAGRSRNGKTQ